MTMWSKALPFTVKSLAPLTTKKTIFYCTVRYDNYWFNLIVALNAFIIVLCK